MVKNYLLVAFRNLIKNKSYVIINAFGLGIGMACCITAYILIAYNIEFDDFHKKQKVGKLFRVHAHVLINGSDKRQAVGVPSPVAPAVTEDIAGIKRYMRYAGNMTIGGAVSYIDESSGVNNTFGEQVVFADSTIFDLFDFPLTKGSYQSFKNLESAFLSEEVAKKYFGDEDPIGKVLKVSFSRGVEKQVIVGGVLAKVPVNSSMFMPFLMRFEHFEEMRELDQPPWGDWNVPATFVELDDPSKAAETAQYFDKFKEQRNKMFKEQEVQRYSLEPFHSKLDQNIMTWSYLNTPIPVEPLIIFIVLAMMILLVACFNLTNTSIAMIAGRLREIGVRKSMGASRTQVVNQFMLETAIVTVLAVIVGYVMSQVIVPEFIAMWELPYGLEDLNGINLILMLLFIVVLTSILAGIYPAVFGSKFDTVTLLKGNVKVKGSSLLTRILVTVQFAISVVVLIGGVVFIQNTKFQEAIDFGYEKEKLLLIDISAESEYRALVAKARLNPDIEVFASTEHQVGFSTYPNPVFFEGTEYEVNHLEFGKNYFESMDFKFINGRAIDYDKASDFKDACVVSRELLKRLNIQGDPIGQVITIREQKRRIVGVIEDFVDNVFRSKEAEPYIFYPTVGERWRNAIVRAENSDLPEIDDYLEEEWKKLFPTKPYSSYYQEEVLMGGLQQTNRNLKKIFFFLTFLGAVLSAVGIYSLASLNIARRKRELGIRKALGADELNILILLNKEFAIVLFLAGIFGGVLGQFGTNALLDFIYANHIEVQLLPVILSALFIFLVGISTTSFTIYKAARANPVDTLRAE